MFAALRRLVLPLLFVAIAALPARAEAPRVVATILPFDGIAAAVMQGAGKPGLLIRGGNSPHTYSLRPSDAEKLSAAQLVIWGGPNLEVSLVDPIAELASNARVLELDKVSGVKLLPYRQGAIWQHGEEPADAGHDDHDHEHEGNNMHFWLDPDNATAIAGAIAGALADLDPIHADLYKKNAVRFGDEMKSLEKQVEAELAPVRGKHFVVFHDAYQYFETRFDMPASGTIALSPERQPGARHVADIHRLIAERHISCVFAEPEFEPRLVSTVIEGTGAHSGVLDPLGADIPPGPDFYPALIRKLATSLSDCLAQ